MPTGLEKDMQKQSDLQSQSDIIQESLISISKVLDAIVTLAAKVELPKSK